MLSDFTATTMIPVHDLEVSRHFYRDCLGLTEVGQVSGEMIEFQTGTTSFDLYRSDNAGTNKGTAMSWTISNGLPALVEELKGRGVAFEHYDIPGVPRDGDIHAAGADLVAWFRDPDGNILCLASPKLS